MKSRPSILAFFAAISGCFSPTSTPPAPKNVMLVVIETLRADHTGPMHESYGVIVRPGSKQRRPALAQVALHWVFALGS